MTTRLCALAILLLGPGWASANLLTNASFETPAATAGFTDSGWTPYGAASPGRDWWSARTGGVSTNYGGFMPGWSGANSGGVYQDVPVGTGTYTFSLWVRHQEAYNPVSDQVRIEWFDADTNILDQVSSTYVVVPDKAWHQVYVTGTCVSQELAFARVIFEASWGAGGAGDTAGFFDDAEFYAGPHRGTPLANGSFERPSSSADSYWRASQWQNTPIPPPYSFEDWADHSGAWGIGLWGWDAAEVSNSVTFHQNLVPGTGTYSFAIYLVRETDFYLSNATLRLEWFDSTFTNKVQADTVTNLVVPNDFAWHEYAVSGSCASDTLYEVRASLFVEWWENTNAGGSKAFKLDDARFLPGLYAGVSLSNAWSYHAATGTTASLESVPGTNVGAFLQVEYASSTSTFYVLTPADGIAAYAGEGGLAGMRTSWQRPENGQYQTSFSDMERLGNVVIGAGAFHGLPAAGAQTQTLWRHRMEFPRDTNGVFYTTNAITVFYSPYVRTTNAVGGETDRIYLVGSGGSATNELGQLFHEVPESRDYSFQLNPPTYAELQNTGFENPAGTDFTDAQWTGFGNIGRDVWAARSGTRGGYFPSWAAGNGGFFQDVAATGGTYTFSLWMKRSLGANINSQEVKLEWFNSAAHLMHAQTNVVSLPADERWHRVYITSTLPSGEARFVRPVVFADFAAGSYPFHEVLVFDDAQLYSGGFTSVQELANGDFETGGTGFEAGYWDAVVSDWVGRDTWAARNGTWGADFQGFETNDLTYVGTLSQGLNVSTGTYVFGLWILAEDSILLTNAELRIEWLDEDFAAVQPPTVQPLTVPFDSAWHYYAVTGSCAVAGLFEVRPVVLGQWDRNLGGGNKALKMDDATFTALVSVDDDGDGLPNTWEALYFGGVTNADATANGDGDAALNWEEYVADTHPTNGASYFPNLITNRSGVGVLVLQAGPPTTNSRVYDIWWTTNLVTGAWTPTGLNVPGQGDGSAVSLSVTNDAPSRSYRTGVKLP